MRIRHLESALSHARAALDAPPAEAPPPPRSQAAAGDAAADADAAVPADVVQGLAKAEQTALRELVKAHTAHGNAARAASLKEAYRQRLDALKTARVHPQRREAAEER